jgi:hypothetical protein
MSLRCMVWVFDLLSQGEVPGGASTALVFLKLADRANDDGVCWPGLDTLGRDVGLSRRTVEGRSPSSSSVALLGKTPGGTAPGAICRMSITWQSTRGGVKLTGACAQMTGGVRQVTPKPVNRNYQ